MGDLKLGELTELPDSGLGSVLLKGALELLQVVKLETDNGVGGAFGLGLGHVVALGE